MSRWRRWIELAAVDVGRDRIDHRIPAIAGLETGAARRGRPRLSSRLVRRGRRIVQRADEVGAVLLRKRLAIGALAPGRQSLVDLEIRACSAILTKEFWSAECSQPQPTSKVTSGAAMMVCARPPTRSRASSTITERPESFSAFAAPRPGSAGADDRDVDIGGERIHAGGSSTFIAAPEVGRCRIAALQRGGACPCWPPVPTRVAGDIRSSLPYFCKLS